MSEFSELEKTEEYLFHGSATADIEVLEPRQPMSHGRKDGLPCVAASELAEPAIFMAVFGSKKMGAWNTKDGRTTYYLLKSEFTKAKREGWSGYVYVLDRDTEKFNIHKAWEWRAYTPIKPIRKIRVDTTDIPKNIEFIDSYEQ